MAEFGYVMDGRTAEQASETECGDITDCGPAERTRGDECRNWTDCETADQTIEAEFGYIANSAIKRGSESRV